MGLAHRRSRKYVLRMSTSTPLMRLLSERMSAQSLDRGGLVSALAEHGERVTRQTIDGWCNGTYRPHPDRLAALATVLGCSRAALALAAAGVDEDVEPPAAA